MRRKGEETKLKKLRERTKKQGSTLKNLRERTKNRAQLSKSQGEKRNHEFGENFFCCFF